MHQPPLSSHASLVTAFCVGEYSPFSFVVSRESAQQFVDTVDVEGLDPERTYHFQTLITDDGRQMNVYMVNVDRVIVDSALSDTPVVLPPVQANMQ